MGLLNFLSPTPASHAKGACRAMNLAFHVKMEQAVKNGEKDLTYGELSKRALSTRPGWGLVSDSTFKEKRTGETITIDVQHDSLPDVIKKVVTVEVKSFLMNRKQLSEEEVAVAITEAVQAVDDYVAASRS